MHSSHQRLAVLLVTWLAWLGAPGFTQGGRAPQPVGDIRGTAIDSSAGVLPGVSVVATAADGRQLATTVTDANGEFSLEGLPLGPAVVLFRLDGFVDATAKVTVQPKTKIAGPKPDERLVQRMELAARSESVVVRGDPPLPPPPPPPTIVPVPAHDESSVCGPARAESAVPALGTLLSSKNATRGMFAAGDEVLIEGGATTGLSAGQNLVVRRRYRPSGAAAGPDTLMMGEHSSGLLQIVSVAENTSTAVVVYVCNAMMSGDYLAAFQPEPIRQVDPVGPPLFDLAARILFADAGELVGVTNRMMVIDRGSQRGVRRGQRLTLFRRGHQKNYPPVIVGEAVVVAVRTYSATIFIERATDAIFFGDGGDWAAPQQPPSRF